MVKKMDSLLIKGITKKNAIMAKAKAKLNEACKEGALNSLEIMLIALLVIFLVTVLKTKLTGVSDKVGTELDNAADSLFK